MFDVVDKTTRGVIAKGFATVSAAEAWCENHDVDYDDYEIVSYA